MAFGSAVPYAIEVVRGKTKPRIVSWFTWSLLIGIACAGSFAQHQVANGMLTLFDFLGTFSIVLVGLKYGDRSFEPLDIVCQVGAFVGIGLWLLFNSPMIAIIASITIDLVGSIPTIKHSWQAPHEETRITFVMCFLAATATVFAAAHLSADSLAYPVYILLSNLSCAAAITWSPHRRLSGAPAELREL